MLNQCLQFIAGLFVNGPYALITTAVSTEVAKKVKTKAAVATVCAIIDGTGSIGAAVGPLVASYLDDYGWGYVFYMIIFSNLMAVLSLLRIGIKDIKRILSERELRKKENQINRYSYRL